MFDRRLGALYFLFCAALLCIVARLFELQVLGLTAEDPDAVLRSPLPLEEIPAARGTIFDREGEVLAADQPVLELTIQYDELLALCEMGGNRMFPEELGRIRAAQRREKARKLLDAKKLFPAAADPLQEMEKFNPPAADSLQSRLEALCAATGRDRASLLARVGEIVSRVRQIRRRTLGDGPAETASRSLYEETIPYALAADVSVEAAERVAADPDRFPGVAVSPAWRRTYPLGTFAAHVVGYLWRAPAPQRGEAPEDPDVRPGDWVGKAGAEKQYDSVLRGVPGIINSEPDPKTGRPARNVLFPAQAGSNLWLTLCGPAQRRAEQMLEGLAGAVVVMDVRTGGLLVLASSPSFDPAVRPVVNDLSRATQDSVAPGSVFKPVVALAAAAGGLGIERTFFCDGALSLGNAIFRCEGHHGAVNMEQAIAVSCNIYFYQAARLAGPQAILSWASALNLGRRTGVDLPYEWAGRLPQVGADWRTGQTLNLGIGQGDLSVTPLQIAVMMSVIANGGQSPRPTVRQRIEPPSDGDAPAAPDAPPPCAVALPADGLRAVREGMRQCALVGTASGVPAFRRLKAAVKTGTAETTREAPVNQAWIAGYLPWDSPRWAFAVVVHNVPGFGATIAGPIAAATLDALPGKPE